MTYEELVSDAKRLRHEFEKSEARFFAFLMKVEREHESVWRQAGCSSFEQFLMSNDLCKPHRYIFFRTGVQRCGRLETAIENGAHWTIALGQVRDDVADNAVHVFSDRAETFRSVHNVSPSAEIVRGWSRDVQPRLKDANEKPATELARLREENRILKIELAKAKARLAELEGAEPKAKASAKKRKAA